jgi:hypothetical protein
MSSRQRQLLLLVGLIVTFTVLIGRQLVPALGSAGLEPVAGTSVSSRPVGTADGPLEIAELRLDALEHKPAVYKPGRDPFRFAPRRQRAAAAPKPDQAAERRAARQEQAPRQRPATANQPPRPKPPAVNFVFLGSFGVPGREIAVFSDGQEILNAFAGDVLKLEFVVRRIGYESADIGFVNFPDEPAKRLAVGG